MKLAVNKIISLNQNLNELADKELSVSGAFRLALNMKKIQAAVITFEETRTKLIQELGEKTDEGIEVKSDKRAEFFEKINALLKEEVKVDIEKIKLSDLGDVLIAPKVLANLAEIIEQD